MLDICPSVSCESARRPTRRYPKADVEERARRWMMRSVEEVVEMGSFQSRF